MNPQELPTSTILSSQTVPIKPLLPTLTLIEKAWNSYKSFFKKLWPLSLFTIGLGILAFFSLYALTLGIILFGPKYGFSSLDIGLMYAALYSIAYLIILFLAGVFFRGVADLYRNDYQGVGTAYSRGLKIFWPFMVIGIAFALVLIAGEYLLLIPGVAFFTYLLFSSFEFVVDDKRGIDALLGSWALVKNRWWMIFGKLLLVGLFAGVAVMVAELISVIFFVIVFGLAAILHMEAVMVAFGILCAIIFIAAIILLAYPLILLFYFELYFNLKETRIASNVAVATNKKRKIILIIFMILGILALIFMPIYLNNRLKSFQASFNGISNTYVPLGQDNYNALSFASSTVTLEQNPYVSSNLGFQINQPKGWVIEEVNQGEADFLRVYDPSLKYASELSIISTPNTNGSTDLYDATTQDNFVNLIVGSIPKNGGKALETDRISSTSVKILYYQSGPNQPVSSILIYFRPNRIYEISTKIESVDDNQFINALLSASVSTFKIIPVVSAPAAPISNSSQPQGFVPPLNDVFTSPSVNFTVKYPAQSDWLWTTTKLGQQGIIFQDNDIQTFDSSSENPYARIVISDQVGSDQNYQVALQNQINLILDDFKSPTQVTRNITSFMPPIPNGVFAEVFEVRGGSSEMQGATLTPIDGLFMVAADSNNLYVFDFRSDSQDFNNFYPLVIAILKTFTIRN
jgi:hypothetical protein